MAYKVLIVDDQKMVRQMFETAVNSSPDYEIAGMAQTAEEAVGLCIETNADLVLMDVVTKNGANGLDAAAQIKKAHPEVKIICVTSMPEYSWLGRAREIGVDSFWYKETDEATILDVMNRTIAGESVYPDSAPVVRLGLADSSEFTERELEVLRIITTGASNGMVAAQLGISEYTVKAHVRSMLEKTGYKSRTELAIKARVIGLAISPEKLQ